MKQQWLHNLLLTFLFVAGCSTCVVASYSSSAIDSLVVAAQQTPNDSLVSSDRSYGSIVSVSTDTLFSITKERKRQIQYQSLGELLIRGTPFQAMSLGGYGQYDGISILGNMPNDVAIAFNGRPLQSNWSNTINLSTISPEGIERIEVLTGSTAIGLAPSLTQTAINLQEIRYDSRTPYTGMWYSQGAGDFVAADVVFAQNVGPGLNINAGVRRSGANGRYQQTEFDVWNVRLGARYAYDSMTTVGFNYLVTSHNTNLWGGVLRPDQIQEYSEDTAPVQFSDLRDHQRRHDITIGLSRILTDDSLHSINATAFYVHDAMFRIRDSSITTFTTDTGRFINYRGSDLGLLVRSRHTIGNTLLRFALGSEYIQNDSAPYTTHVKSVQSRVMMHVDQPLSSSLTLQGALQIATQNNTPLIGVGGGITFATTNSTSRLDISFCQHTPSPSQGYGLRPENILLFLAEGTYSSDLVRFRGQVFYRSVSNAIVTTGLRDSSNHLYGSTSANEAINQVGGLVAMASYNSSWLLMQVNLRAHTQLTGRSSIPGFTSTLVLGGTYQLGANSLRGGIQISAIAPGLSSQFLPLTWQFVTAEVTSRNWMLSGGDVFLTANVGHATIKASFENIFAQQWSTTVGYPMISRDFRLSVVWSFFD